MKAPFQNLIDKLKPVVSEKDELEFRDMSELEDFLALPSNQNSKSDVEIIVQDFWKRTFHFRCKVFV